MCTKNEHLSGEDTLADYLGVWFTAVRENKENFGEQKNKTGAK